MIGDEATDVLLVEMLDKAVLAGIEHLRQMPDGRRRKLMDRWRRRGPKRIAEQGDILRYAGDRPEKVAAAFRILAVGLVALAHAPGGVTVFDRHWCVDHGVCEQAAAEAARRLEAA